MARHSELESSSCSVLPAPCSRSLLFALCSLHFPAARRSPLHFPLPGPSCELFALRSSHFALCPLLAPGDQPVAPTLRAPSSLLFAQTFGTSIPFFTAGRAAIASYQRFTLGKSSRLT